MEQDAVLRISHADAGWGIIARKRVWAITGGRLPTVEDYHAALVQCLKDKAALETESTEEKGTTLSYKTLCPLALAPRPTVVLKGEQACPRRSTARQRRGGDGTGQWHYLVLETGICPPSPSATRCLTSRPTTTRPG